MGAADQHVFDALRARHYPPGRNRLRAHITLFHQLPPSCLGELDRLLKAIAAGAPPPAAIGGVISLDRGVAYRVDSPALLAIREAIADWFAGSLSAQDRGVPRLHITVQNKVASAAARALLAELRRDFRARPLAIAGLAAHYYRGGPWETVATRNFRGRS
ncbi:2'-5' RNA ligase family protein [Sphingopyxis sp. PET50]|uniref:2'-5' RNA ligase family protein n=1 Tax=Sphingopyxis sp. PET50 TaxID=2976533 RepID=UPI0021AEFA9A|nr:2'-5' RNA ligase family protein [Sphingopyxis sp. PET50]